MIFILISLSTSKVSMKVYQVNETLYIWAKSANRNKQKLGTLINNFQLLSKNLSGSIQIYYTIQKNESPEDKKLQSHSLLKQTIHWLKKNAHVNLKKKYQYLDYINISQITVYFLSIQANISIFVHNFVRCFRATLWSTQNSSK